MSPWVSNFLMSLSIYHFSTTKRLLLLTKSWVKRKKKNWKKKKKKHSDTTRNDTHMRKQRVDQMLKQSQVVRWKVAVSKGKYQVQEQAYFCWPGIESIKAIKSTRCITKLTKNNNYNNNNNKTTAPKANTQKECALRRLKSYAFANRQIAFCAVTGIHKSDL